MKQPSFGIVGCEHAHIGVFIEEMVQLGYRCLGIYNENGGALAANLAHQYQVPLLDDPTVIWHDPECRLVGSSAINAQKIDIVEQAEHYGKPIMLDKPAVVNRSGLDRLRAVIERGKIQVGLMLTERFEPTIYTLKQMIDRGELGKIVQIGMRKPHREGNQRPAWFYDKALSGGIIIDLLIHDVDLLRWLTGSEITQMSGYMGKTGRPEHPGFYDLAQLQVVMDNGVLAQLHADWHTPAASWTWGDGRIFVAGTAGCAELRLNADPLITDDSLLLVTGPDQGYRQVTPLTPPQSMMADFLRALDGEDSCVKQQDVWLATLATIEADEQVHVTNRA